MRLDTRQILVFLLFAFAISCIPYALVISSGHLGTGNGMVVQFLMWCPALAAFLTCSIFRIDVASLGWSWRPVKYEALGYAFPWLYSIPVYLACWVATKGSFAFPQYAQYMAGTFGMGRRPSLATLCLGIPLLAIFGVILGIAYALGEEIGWRGYLLPRLVHRFGFRQGCLFSGLIWAMWHYPILLFADYNAGTDKRYALVCFTLMVIGDAYVLGWLRLRSGSLWPCVLLHASHNLVVQQILDPLTRPVSNLRYITTEFGAGMVVTIAVLALVLCSRPVPASDILSPRPAPATD